MGSETEIESPKYGFGYGGIKIFTSKSNDESDWSLQYSNFDLFGACQLSRGIGDRGCNGEYFVDSGFTSGEKSPSHLNREEDGWFTHQFPNGQVEGTRRVKVELGSVTCNNKRCVSFQDLEILASPKSTYTSCMAILEEDPLSKDGTYWLAPTEDGQSPRRVYCKMESDGGGWALVAKWDGLSQDHSNEGSVNAPSVICS